MTTAATVTRPQRIADITGDADSLRTFGMNLRDWQHEIERSGVRSRPELARRIADEPPVCRGRFDGGDVADAYLAAYAEWLADQAGIARPVWSCDARRVAQAPWFSTSLRGYLLVHTPASFRQRNIFTIPEAIFTPARGRPRVPVAQKREKARRRQKAYRARIRALVAKARALPE
jgi:hypothetical protein